ncbi:BTAD domain-containing putative transcriptional regulator [Modestobacter versicolor]|uniref:BTAD domain-containing putative transcriptional regulator n=1 Tax=Modestobacter versicolor TaxID=429133 RepID=UPI0034DE26E7
MTAAGRLELQVLGPLAATLDGVPVDLRGPKQRAVLACLVAVSPRMVPADQLRADVWPGPGPPDVATLHYYVSQLRGALEPGRPRGQAPAVLVRRGPGYALQVPPDAVDAVRFEQLAARGCAALAAGDPATAVGSLTGALDCWRGPAYADVAGLPALAPDVVRLEELRLATTEALLDALLRTGRHAEVVGRAEEHTARHPLRERGWELLALALYRSGRQADALGALRTVRGVLAEELGLDPGPGLVAVERTVRSQAPLPPAGAPAAPVAAALPTPLTDLVGREALAREVAAALATARLLTLTGPGGVGKTRLALEVAHRRRDAEGPWFVELAALSDPTLLAATVADVLGLPGVADAARLAAVLGGRPGLLVLDNAEHLVDAVAELVGTVLPRCPGLTVLVTSREVLDVAGETTVDVPPLDPEGDAVELFTRRARAAAPGWTAAPGEVAVVRRIAADLDGLPLALELAAARLRVLSVEELAEGLVDRFGLLRGRRDAPDHQRGLAGTVAWSYRSLSAAEAELFRRLAVFPDGFDLAGATALAGAGAPAVELLSSLVRRSLVTTVPGPGPRRHRLLETLRSFAVAHSDPAEVAETAARHRRLVLQRSAAAARRARGREAARALDELRRGRPDQRAALASAAEAGDGEYLLDLCGALGWSWYRAGDIAEGLVATRTALTTAGDARPGDAAGCARRARAMAVLGSLSYLAADLDTAREVMPQAVRLARAGGDPAQAAHVEAWTAHLTSFGGDPAEVLATAEHAVAAAAACGERWVEAEALMILGMARRSTGAGGALPVLREAVAVAEDAGHAWGLISTTWALMKAAIDSGDLTEALTAGARMREPLEAEGDVTSWIVLLHTTACALALSGRTSDAALLAGAAAAHGDRVGFDPARMDPVDGPREAAAVRAALPPEEYERLTAEGRRWSRSEVSALLCALVS